MFKQEESPLRYGIMYSETYSTTVETVWYETAELRDDAVQYLIETGTLEIKPLPSRGFEAKVVEPYAFSVVDANELYYKRQKSI